MARAELGIERNRFVIIIIVITTMASLTNIFCKNIPKGHRDDNRADAIKQYNIKDTSIVMVG
jgi:hypothetical protein